MSSRTKLFMLLGDSLTEYSFRKFNGWGPRFLTAYGRRADVLNRGFGGYNTKAILTMLDKILPPSGSRLDFVNLWIGGNDAAHPGTEGDYHVPVKQYRENLLRIIDAINKHSPGVSIAIGTPTPCDEPVCEKFCREEFDIHRGGWSNEHGIQYVDACEEVAIALGIPYINYFRDMQNPKSSPHFDSLRDVIQEDYRQYFYDGMHFSDEGHLFAFRALTSLIRKELPHLTPEKLPLFLPLFRDIK